MWLFLLGTGSLSSGLSCGLCPSLVLAGLSLMFSLPGHWRGIFSLGLVLEIYKGYLYNSHLLDHVGLGWEGKREGHGFEGEGRKAQF